MKSSILTLSVITFATAELTLPASARGGRTPGVAHRQGAQHERIAEGVKSGQLTESKAQGLRQEQQAIRTEKQAYKADGVVTPAERKDLHQDQNQASKDIYNAKHNDQVATPPAGGAPTPPPLPAPRNINQRQWEQQARIAQGVKSGQLTAAETKSLEATQKQIRTEEKAYRADGKLTGAERKDLNQDLNAASKQIYADKHNGSTQGNP
ncbi:MAG TPA: hypothetical protein DCM86_16595 [Verrucomicrobiales bacterium]|nr:hypothetical protein [Verrucomicrobiales bacterium]